MKKYKRLFPFHSMQFYTGAVELIIDTVHDLTERTIESSRVLLKPIHLLDRAFLILIDRLQDGPRFSVSKSGMDHQISASHMGEIEQRLEVIETILSHMDIDLEVSEGLSLDSCPPQWLLMKLEKQVKLLMVECSRLNLYLVTPARPLFVSPQSQGTGVRVSYSCGRSISDTCPGGPTTIIWPGPQLRADTLSERVGKKDNDQEQTGQTTIYLASVDCEMNKTHGRGTESLAVWAVLVEDRNDLDHIGQLRADDDRPKVLLEEMCSHEASPLEVGTGHRCYKSPMARASSRSLDLSTSVMDNADPSVLIFCLPSSRLVEIEGSSSGGHSRLLALGQSALAVGQLPLFSGSDLLRDGLYSVPLLSLNGNEVGHIRLKVTIASVETTFTRNSTLQDFSSSDFTDEEVLTALFPEILDFASDEASVSLFDGLQSLELSQALLVTFTRLESLMVFTSQTPDIGTMESAPVRGMLIEILVQCLMIAVEECLNKPLLLLQLDQALSVFASDVMMGVLDTIGSSTEPRSMKTRSFVLAACIRRVGLKSPGLRVGIGADEQAKMGLDLMSCSEDTANLLSDLCSACGDGTPDKAHIVAILASTSLLYPWALFVLAPHEVCFFLDKIFTMAYGQGSNDPMILNSLLGLAVQIISGFHGGLSKEVPSSSVWVLWPPTAVQEEACALAYEKLFLFCERVVSSEPIQILNRLTFLPSAMTLLTSPSHLNDWEKETAPDVIIPPPNFGPPGKRVITAVPAVLPLEPFPSAENDAKKNPAWLRVIVTCTFCLRDRTAPVLAEVAAKGLRKAATTMVQAAKKGCPNHLIIKGFKLYVFSLENVWEFSQVKLREDRSLLPFALASLEEDWGQLEAAIHLGTADYLKVKLHMFLLCFLSHRSNPIFLLSTSLGASLRVTSKA